MLKGQTTEAIEVSQVKTGKRVSLPIHPALATEIKQTPQDRLTFLLAAARAPFPPRGFYSLFAEWTQEAGLPQGRSPQGLREVAVRRLAEAGATTHQIMSVLGVTLQTAEIYARKAERAGLAVAAFAALHQAEK